MVPAYTTPIFAAGTKRSFERYQCARRTQRERTEAAISKKTQKQELRYRVSANEPKGR
jgi:hypothetical protein